MQLSLPDSAKITDFPFATEFVFLASVLNQCALQAIWRQKWGMDSTDSFLKSGTLNSCWFFPLGYFLDSRTNM